MYDPTGAIPWRLVSIRGYVVGDTLYAVEFVSQNETLYVIGTGLLFWKKGVHYSESNVYTDFFGEL